MQNYFSTCSTLQEVKDLYRTLAKENHPDKGGNLQTMQEINNQYTKAINTIAKGGKFTAAEAEAEILNAEQYKNIVEILLQRTDIDIELCGCWLWVTPKDANIFWELWPDMKKAGLFFAKVKRKFYFRGIEYATGNKGKSLDMAKIRTKYGSQAINSNYKQSYKLTA